MKKLLWGLLWMSLVFWAMSLPNLVNADDEEFTDVETYEWIGDWFSSTNNLWRWTQMNGYNADVAWSDSMKDDSLINVIRTAINWVLWMLSLVALVIALYAGFLMMTSGWDEKKYQKWVGLLKWAGIWLAIIALSWLIVSLIFWVINGAIGNSASWNSVTTESIEG
jgi:hypothetical protein